MIGKIKPQDIIDVEVDAADVEPSDVEAAVADASEDSGLPEYHESDPVIDSDDDSDFADAPLPADDSLPVDDSLLVEDSLPDDLSESVAVSSKAPIDSPASKAGPRKPRAKPKSRTSSSRALEIPNALSAYMSQLADHAPITREEEHELAVRWTEEGDVDAARQMVLSNLRLVVKIAMEYRRAWTNTLDLIQEGNVGLMEAVQRYDPYQGVKLSSYAVYWIRAYILKYILDHMRTVRLGTTRAGRKLFFRLNKEKRALELEGYEVSPKLLAERLDVKESDVVEMEARLSRPDTSLDAPRYEGSDSITYGDTFSAPGHDAETEVGRGEMLAVFRTAIDEFSETLGERDMKILNERVLADEPKTLAEMGEEFGVSRERVRQLEARIVKDLRNYMKESMVDFEYYAPDSSE